MSKPLKEHPNIVESAESTIKERKKMSHRLNHGTHRHHSNVNHPDHYQSDKMEVIDIIEAFELNFHLGNVVKYITRSDKKGNSLEDLEKAKWYLQREINKRYKQQSSIVTYSNSSERLLKAQVEEQVDVCEVKEGEEG